MMKRIFLVIGMVLLLSVPAMALTLEDVIGYGADGIQIDDKLFYNFAYSSEGGPQPSAITFTPLPSPSNNPGFTLNAGWVADTLNEVVDSNLDYNVKIIEGGAVMTDVSFLLTNLLITGNATLSLSEDVYLGLDNTGPNIAHLEALALAGDIEASDSALLTDPDTGLPITTTGPIFVSKDLLLSANDGYVGMSDWTNRHSQQVPEPSTLMMLGSGLLGFALMRRKSKKG